MSIKGYELMKLVAENPEKYEGKKYKTTASYVFNINGGSFENVEVYSGDIVISDNKNHRALINSLVIFEEIKQPVTPQEAAKAYRNGKTIRAYIPNDGEFLITPTLFSAWSTSTWTRMIADGIWYIEN